MKIVARIFLIILFRSYVAGWKSVDRPEAYFKESLFIYLRHSNNIIFTENFSFFFMAFQIFHSKLYTAFKI